MAALAKEEYMTQPKDLTTRLAFRYQNQPWYIKRWRDRHLLKIPYLALRIWLYSDESFRHSWWIACGLCDGDRDYWYTTKEVQDLEATGQ